MSGLTIQEGPFIDQDTVGNESMRGPREKYPGLLTDLDQNVRESQVFSDGVIHTLCPFIILPDRHVEIKVSIRVQDNTGQAAFLDDILFISRFGAGNLTLTGGGAAVLGFRPNVGPWNTCSAVPNLVPNNPALTYAVIAPNLPLVRWTVSYQICGSQAK